VTSLPDIDWQPLPWPVDGTDPFAPAPEVTCWFAARNGGISRVFPAGDWRDWGTWDDFERAVPMGYTQLSGEERLAVCLDGRVAGEWTPYDGRPPGACTVVHLEEARGHWYARTAPADSYEAALADAVRRSAEGARRTLVAQQLRSTHWH
jgi:hypothetical protein